jgi:N-acetylneuraminic acid mutarotase
MKKSLLTRFALLFTFVISSPLFFAQDFTWKKGSNQTNQNGAYGTPGVGAPVNNPGGRYGMAYWKDQSGNFWMFGGEGLDFIGNSGYLSDLWKYDPTSNIWTFMKGNDLIAQIGSYGTLGVSSATNNPGGRQGAVHWADASGNLWMFGGYGYDSTPNMGYLSDLWKYTISTNEWTWMGGSNLWWTTANYGTQGVPSTTNIPGARAFGSGWADATGNLWLFGGEGITTSSTTSGYLNDLWKYTISTNEWTWVKGSNILDQNGVYGTIGTSAPANVPGSRMGSATWVDNVGNFWMHSGDGFDATSTGASYLNDLWKYNVPTNEWTWIKGTNTINENGTYGLQGVASTTNSPGGRVGAQSWVDAANNLWLFGGEGLPGTGAISGYLNDVWKYEITTGEWMWVKGSAIIDQNGFYGTQGVPSYMNRPGGRVLCANWIDGNNNLFLFGGDGFPASGSSNKLNDMWKYTNCFVSPITMTIVSKDSTICAGQSTSLTASGSNNYLWNPGLNTTPYLAITPSVTSTYTVSTSDSNGCIYTATFTEVVDPCNGIEMNAQKNAVLIYPNPNKDAFYVELTREESGDLIIINSIGQKVFEEKINTGRTLIKHDLPCGVYYFELKQSDLRISSGKILVE